MPEISEAELAKLKKAAEYGRRAKKHAEAIDTLRRANRTGNGFRRRFSVKGVGHETERKFREQAAAAGWDVSKRGWPDFILRRDDGSVAFVEVKAYARKSLKPEQTEIASLLAAAGFKVYRWDPESGFSRIYAAPETAPTPGGSTMATEPATRGRDTAGALLRSGTGSLSSSAHRPARRRVGQGTRRPEVAGP